MWGYTKPRLNKETVILWYLVQLLPGCGSTAFKAMLVMQAGEVEGTQQEPEVAAGSSLAAQDTCALENG